MIVAIDGPDGAGKSTQIRMLAAWARERGLACRVVSKWDLLDAGAHPETRFLRGTTLEELRACVSEMPSPARALFLMWLISCAGGAGGIGGHDGELVIMDGFWVKHAAAELEYGCDPEIVEALTGCLPAVDALVYLDVTPEVALARKGDDLTPYECGREPGCSPEGFLRHQRAVRARLLRWAAERGWHVLDTADRDGVQEGLRRIVMSMPADVLQAQR